MSLHSLPASLVAVVVCYVVTLACVRVLMGLIRGSVRV